MWLGTYFNEGINAIKFDDTRFYREDFNNLPGGKGVDILAASASSDIIQLIEIKNCTGHESENAWRIGVNNRSRSKVLNGLDEYDRDSLDIEVSKKVAMTISCIYGAWSLRGRVDRASEIEEYWGDFNSPKIPNLKRKIYVSLFLEGEFGSKTRSKKMIMKRIQDSLNKKLQWLNCVVTVVDSNTYNPKYYRVS